VSQLTANWNGSYTYDANGNTLADPSGKSYTWDLENRLTQAIVPGTNGVLSLFGFAPSGSGYYSGSARHRLTVERRGLPFST
jgi:hypothetical protein